MVLSGDLGIVKPDHRIYYHTLKRLAVEAAEAVFVDDSPANVRAAEACGMQAILFSATDLFIREFEKLGK